MAEIGPLDLCKTDIRVATSAAIRNRAYGPSAGQTYEGFPIRTRRPLAGFVDSDAPLSGCCQFTRGVLKDESHCASIVPFYFTALTVTWKRTTK